MILTEEIEFQMPRNRELQFPAVSVMQSYVNNYQLKMRANCILQPMPDFRLRYSCDLSDADWTFWQRAGLKLNQMRSSITFPDASISLLDERIESFHSEDKHAAQICSAIGGVEALPFPRIRQVKPDMTVSHVWTLRQLPDSIYGDQLVFDNTADVIRHDEEDLLTAVDGCIGCVIGVQSVGTYLAAAMGLPVIEILPSQRDVHWLSKWMNPMYRVVEDDRLELVGQALRSIRGGMRCRLDQDHRSRDVGQTLTGVSPSIAQNATDTLETVS